MWNCGRPHCVDVPEKQAFQILRQNTHKNPCNQILVSNVHFELVKVAAEVKLETPALKSIPCCDMLAIRLRSWHLLFHWWWGSVGEVEAGLKSANLADVLSIFWDQRRPTSGRFQWHVGGVSQSGIPAAATPSDNGFLVRIWTCSAAHGSLRLEENLSFPLQLWRERDGPSSSA